MALLGAVLVVKMKETMKFRIGLEDAGLTALGVVLLLLLYCFASNGRYESTDVSYYGGEFVVIDRYKPNIVYLDTWRGRLCYFDSDGNKKYLRNE